MTTRDTLLRLAEKFDAIAKQLGLREMEAADKRNFAYAAYKQAEAEAYRSCASHLRAAAEGEKDNG